VRWRQRRGAARAANNDVANTASLQRGAATFVNYCLGCHSARYVRYNTLAAYLGLTEAQLIDNLMFTGERPFDTMEIAMRPRTPRAGSASAAGPVPDLAQPRRTTCTVSCAVSMPTRARVSGWNNLYLENSAMPNVLWELQGIRSAVYEQAGDDGRTFERFRDRDAGTAFDEAEFDQVVRDIVNFLDFIGEPVQLERQALGIRVIAFLLVFLLVAYFLKREIWKDVK
jgi:ubiquinol-cytochrome c reductase cytochrome c1 subunit